MKLAVIQSLLALCLLPLGSNFAQAQKPEDTARLLKTLLQDYKAYGLPLIPEKAQLAVIETEVPNLVKPEELWLYRHVVFVTRDAKHQSWLVQPPLTHLKIKLHRRWKPVFLPPIVENYLTPDINYYWAETLNTNTITPNFITMQVDYATTS